jgi:DNA-binding HxlR family transcriptional regulator
VPYSAHPQRSEYKLTPKGKAFVPILVAMRTYGEEWEPQAKHRVAQMQ